MKKIPLTKGQKAIVDDHWYDYLMQWKWCAWWSKDTNSYYAVRTDYSSGKRNVWMHRIVAKTPDGMQCDHVHHNTLDNRESELRNVTRSQNQMNRPVQNNNLIGIKGIYKRQDNGLYRARLTKEKILVLDQSFETLQEAIDARKDAEKKYFKEFNFPV